MDIEFFTQFQKYCLFEVNVTTIYTDFSHKKKCNVEIKKVEFTCECKICEYLLDLCKSLLK